MFDRKLVTSVWMGAKVDISGIVTMTAFSASENQQQPPTIRQNLVHTFQLINSDTKNAVILKSEYSYFLILIMQCLLLYSVTPQVW